MGAESLLVALVTPFAWPIPSAVNQHVADLARELLARGHRPVVVCSSDDARELHRMRRLTRRADGKVNGLLTAWDPGIEPDVRLLPPVGCGPLRTEDGIPVVPLGRTFPVWVNRSVASIGLPVDVTSRLERLLTGVGFDLVHVHEPVAPSLSFTTIRETRSPVVATFHLTPAGLLAYDVGRGILGRFFGRLDGRIATSEQAGEVLSRSFPGTYHTIPVGTRLASAPSIDSAFPAGPRARRGLYVYRGDDVRGFRAFVRALGASFGEDLEQVTVAVHRQSAERWAPHPAPRKLRSHLRWVEFSETDELQPLYDEADLVFLPYLGGEWLVPALSEAIVAGRPAVAPDLPVVRDILRGVPGVRLFDPRREPSLATCLHDQAACRAPQGDGALSDPVRHTSGGAAEEILELYGEVMAHTSRRTGTTGVAHRAPTKRRVYRLPAGRPDWIFADLHVHTSYSKDCAVPVEAVLSTAREVGLGAIAIADHNTIDGALEAARISDGDPIVIVAEEIMTRSGEVIGLFLEECIPKKLSFEETLSRIKEQGGLVYVPHPFDGLRLTPSYKEMVDNLHRIDAIETYNTRNYLDSFDLNA